MMLIVLYIYFNPSSINDEFTYTQDANKLIIDTTIKFCISGRRAFCLQKTHH